MRQKVRFEKNLKAGKLTVLESSEVDPGVVMPLHEEDYSLEEVSAASAEGAQAFSRIIRRRSFFPSSDFCQKLFEQTVEFFKTDTQEKISVEYDDVEVFPTEEKFLLESDVELDSILEEDGDTKEDEMKEIDSEDDTPKFMPEDTSEHEN